MLEELRGKVMIDWINVVLFGIVVMVFVLGFSSIIMSFMIIEIGVNVMKEKIEYGFFGVLGLIVCLVMGYVFV